MATKKGSRKYPWRGYLVQVSVVIIGVMVTFIGSGLIDRWRQARQVRQVMQLVVSELETNRAQMQRTCEKLIRERHGLLMFGRYQYDAGVIPEDSLKFYNTSHIIGSSVGLTLQNDALEVLKSSGYTASVGDKQLLMDVLGCYNRLDGFREALDSYNELKSNAMKHLFEYMSPQKRDSFSTGNPNALRASWKTILDDPLCMSFIGFSAYYFGDDEYILRRVADVDKTIAGLKEKYRFE